MRIAWNWAWCSSGLILSSKVVAVDGRVVFSYWGKFNKNLDYGKVWMAESKICIDATTRFCYDICTIPHYILNSLVPLKVFKFGRYTSWSVIQG